MISHQFRLLVAAIVVCVAGNGTHAAPIVMQFSGTSTAGEIRFQNKALPAGTHFSIIGFADTSNRELDTNFYGLELDAAYVRISGKGVFRFIETTHISSSTNGGDALFSFGVLYKPPVTGQMPSEGLPAWDMTTSLAPTTLVAKDTFLMQTLTTDGNFSMYGIGFPQYSLSFAASVGPFADFDGDQVVDVDDLDAWRFGFGKIADAGVMDGDGDRDGDVDGADFLMWQRGYSPTATVVAVPEPTALMLISVALLMTGRRLRLG